MNSYKIYYRNVLIAVVADRTEAIEMVIWYGRHLATIGGCWSADDAAAFQSANVRW